MAKRPSSAARRTHGTEADARGVLAEWEHSGKSLEAFARSRGLVPQRLAWWRKRLRAARPESTARPSAPARGLAAAAADPAAVIRLPHGVVIEIDGVSPAWVAALTRELARSA